MHTIAVLCQKFQKLAHPYPTNFSKLTTSFRNTSPMRLILFSNMSKSLCRFHKRNENFAQKSFVLLDKCIRIGCDKFSLLWRKLLPSAVNWLANSHNISNMSIRETFSDWISLRLIKENGKSAVVQVSAVFGTYEHVDSRKVF